MKDQIKKLEVISKGLEPGKTTLLSWSQKVQQYAMEFLDRIDSTKAYERQDSSKSIHFHRISENGIPLDALLEIVKSAVDTPGINPASGGHLGYIPGGGVYPSALGDYIADITNRYAGIYFANPGAVRMENILIRWMADMIGYPKSAHGNLASGGSIANLIAITTARDAQQITWDKIPKSVIYLSEQTHHCVHKAIRIAGLGDSTLRNVRLDKNYRMDPQHLRKLIHSDLENGMIPFMIVASIGSTDTGAVDPVREIGLLAKEYGIWYHIDAAYGGFFILVDELKHHFEGVELSDSYVVDPHKGLFLPYGVGAVLVKDGQAMHASHFYQANYMQDAMNSSDEISPADLSPELTKHFRGLRMWLPLQLFGIRPFRAGLKEKWLLCQYFYKKIREIGFEVGPEPELSVAIYRFIPKEKSKANQFNQLLVKAIQDDGRIFISSTTIQGTYWIRLAVLCFRTHLKQVDLLLEIIEKERDKLLNSDLS